jgi:hypothetical protein
MKRWLVGTGLFFICIVFISSLILAEKSTGGRLDLSELSFDFGVVPREAKVMHKFLLKNIGNDTLKILDVKVACGCTTAPVGKKILAANDTTSMPVTFSSGRRSGSSTKGISIITDQEPRGRFNMTIKAYVESPTMKPPKFYAEPRSLEFKPDNKGASGSSEVQIINEYDHDVIIKMVGFAEDLGSAKLSREKLKAGDKATLTFEFKENSSSSDLYGSVTMEVMGDEDMVYNYSVPVIRKHSSQIKQ